jgi:hypothetical protein
MDRRGWWRSFYPGEERVLLAWVAERASSSEPLANNGEEPVTGVGGVGDCVPSGRVQDHRKADDLGVVAGDISGTATPTANGR